MPNKSARSNHHEKYNKGKGRQNKKNCKWNRTLKRPCTFGKVNSKVALYVLPSHVGISFIATREPYNYLTTFRRSPNRDSSRVGGDATAPNFCENYMPKAV